MVRTLVWCWCGVLYNARLSWTFEKVVMVCCRCNRSGRCKNCQCVKRGTACVDCLPSRQGSCSNHPIPPPAPSSAADIPTSTSTSISTAVPARPAVCTSDVIAPAQHHLSVASTSMAVPTTSNSGLCPGVPGCSLSTTDAPASLPLPSLESVLRIRVPTLRHVPKSSRDAWAGVVGDICRTIVSDPLDLGSWVKFFMLARCILANPPRGGRSHWRDTQKAVRSRIAKWKAGQLLELWDDILVENNRLKNIFEKRINSPVHGNIHRARRAVVDGQFRKALQTLSSAGFAPSSSDVYDAMLSKHPQSAPPPIPSTPVPPAIQVSELDVVRALQSFPNGTAPGPSSLRANHLKEAVFCPSPIKSDFALKGLMGVINLLAAGRAPRNIIPFLCGASLLACQKKDGGLRPIAVGEVLRRLTSKCVVRAVQSEAVTLLSPLQVGVGVSAGCEAIVHSLASILNDGSILPESRCTLLVDFSNAFNSIDRGLMFEEARARIPSMSSWLECCYSSQPLLVR